MASLLAIALFCAACGVSAKKAGNPPVWGSSPKYSTIPGFIEGRWILEIDISKATDAEDTKRVVEAVPVVLSFTSDGAMELDRTGCKVHGNWKATKAGIWLTATDVDGIPVEQVKKEGLALEGVSISGNLPRYRWHALQQVYRSTLLTLDPDGKRLVPVVRGFGPNHPGPKWRMTYVRLESG